MNNNQIRFVRIMLELIRQLGVIGFNKTKIATEIYLSVYEY